MNETGTKMTTKLKVVAMTARPMSSVAARAASNGVMAFSSTKRKIFSSTTMASSITTPTINTSASMVTLFKREVQRPHHAEGGNHRSRNRHRRDQRRAPGAHEGSTTRQARMLPRIRCMLISCSAA